MRKTITLHVSNPDGFVGNIDGFRFFWAHYVDGYDPKQHCQMCFKGASIPEFNTATAKTGTSEPALPDSMTRCQNFQFAVEYFGYPGVTRA